MICISCVDIISAFQKHSTDSRTDCRNNSVWWSDGASL